MPQYGVEWQTFAVISINYLLVYENKYDLQIYLDNCAYTIVDKKIIDYLNNNLFKTDKDYFNLF